MSIGKAPGPWRGWEIFKTFHGWARKGSKCLKSVGGWGSEGKKVYHWWTEANQIIRGQARREVHICASNSKLAECPRGKSLLTNVHRPKGTLDNCYHVTVGSYYLSIRRGIIFSDFLCFYNTSEALWLTRVRINVSSGQEPMKEREHCF